LFRANKNGYRSHIVKSMQMRILPLALAALCLAAPHADGSHPVMARHAMVVAQEPQAADVGIAVLRSGGNAVDAAIAVAVTRAVTHPTAGNLGGGGCLLVRLADGRSTCIDFRERAPQ
jgi:gamma-glutamyltranspeptidase/glutathione hydrolase